MVQKGIWGAFQSILETRGHLILALCLMVGNPASANAGVDDSAEALVRTGIERISGVNKHIASTLGSDHDCDPVKATAAEAGRVRTAALGSTSFASAGRTESFGSQSSAFNSGSSFGGSGGSSGQSFSGQIDGQTSWAKEKGAEGQEWEKAAAKYISELFPELLDTAVQDMNDWCSNYQSMGRDKKLSFWVHLLAAMSKHESSHKPDTNLTTSSENSNGLLQLTSTDSTKWRSVEKCPEKVSSNEDLKKPIPNICWGAGILKDQIANSFKIGARTGSEFGYWAVLGASGKPELVQKVKKTLGETYGGQCGGQGLMADLSDLVGVPYQLACMR